MSSKGRQHYLTGCSAALQQPEVIGDGTGRGDPQLWRVQMGRIALIYHRRYFGYINSVFQYG